MELYIGMRLKFTMIWNGSSRLSVPRLPDFPSRAFRITAEILGEADPELEPTKSGTRFPQW